jgi:hypothetical protein
MSKPNFIIVGPAKCGTTSLHSYLQRHPDIFMSEPKEPCYFCRPWPQDVGLPQTDEEYLALFDGVTHEKVVGEASANYLFSPDAPQRICDMLGNDVKLLIMFRHPVDMMYSLWEHAVRGGWENREVRQALLASSLDEELTDETHKSFWTTLYLRRANYAEQLERYYALFPRENIKIFLFEEFYAPGYPLYSELLEFLGVEDGYYPDGTRLNQGVKLYNRGLNAFFHRTYPLYIFPVIQYIVPHVVRKNVKKAIVSVAKSIGRKQNESVREILEERLYESVRRLEGMLGRDLSRVWF